MSPSFLDINFDLKQLPVMPEVAAQTIKLINSQDASADQLATVVSQDPIIMARVLKIANSSFYSMSRRVNNLSTAIVILGEKTLQNLVLASSLQGLHKTFGPLERMLWEDSLVCALGSRFLAEKLDGVDPEAAFLAGLFRHIGKVVLSRQHSSLIEEVVKSESHSMAQRERSEFGADHAAVGAAALEYWQLSEMLSQVALHHYDSDIADIEDEETVRMIHLVNLTNVLPVHFGIFGAPTEIDFSSLPGAVYFGLDTAVLNDYVREFKTLFQQNKAAFVD